MSLKHAPVFLFRIACLAALVRSGDARPIDDALTSFDTAVQEDSRQLYGGKGDSGRAISMLKEAQREIGGRRWRAAIESVQQLQYLIGTAQVAATAAPLVTQLRMIEREDENEYLRQIDAAVEKAANACRTAQRAADLDNVIAELTPLVQRWPNDGRQESRTVAQMREKVRSASRYLQYWQDYLSLRESGNDAEAARKMNELAGQYEWYPVVPRSEVLARAVPPAPRELPPLDPQEKIREAFATVQSVSDLDRVHNELNNLAKLRPDYPELRAAAEKVGALVRARVALASGDFGAAWRACAAHYHIVVPSDLMEQWRTEVLRAVLPKYLAPDSVVPPRGDEDPADYLRRIAKAAAARQRWKLVLDSFVMLRELSFPAGGGPAWLGREIAAAGNVVTAEREIDAGNHAAAYQSYGRALAAPSDLVPAQVISARMRALRQKHPDVIKPPRRQPRGE